MHLVDDKYLVLADLWRDARLFHQRLDVLHRVVGCRIQFEDVEGALFVESLTALTLSTSLAIGSWRLAVDSFCEDTGAGCLSYTTWSAEEVGVSQFPALNGIFQCGGQCLLSYHGVKRGRSVLSR